MSINLHENVSVECTDLLTNAAFCIQVVLIQKDQRTRKKERRQSACQIETEISDGRLKLCLRIYTY